MIWLRPDQDVDERGIEPRTFRRLVMRSVHCKANVLPLHHTPELVTV